MRILYFIAAILLAPAHLLAQPSPEAISEASYAGGPLPEGQSAITVVVQILLDRAAISPGVIDGFRGPMSRSAIRAFESREGLEADGIMDSDVWQALNGNNRGQVLRSHRITEEDTGGLTNELPEDYAELAEMDWLGYTSVAERLAEDFHMDQEFLRSLNPEAAFEAGETIFVAATGDLIDKTVTRVEVRKDAGRVAAFAKDGTMVANYPATVGSAELPSPSGTHEIAAIAIEPTYTYRPDENFRQGDNDEKLVLPAGPNGPVGIVWIDLTAPTYGIHGTSDPDQLFQDQSHGCVRLTNWDARELAGMVDQGTPVDFVPEET